MDEGEPVVVKLGEAFEVSIYHDTIEIDMMCCGDWVSDDQARELRDNLTTYLNRRAD